MADVGGGLRAKPSATGGIAGLGAPLPPLDDFYDFSMKLTAFWAYSGLNSYIKTYSDDS